MHRIRVYVDTSVFGGTQDEEFAGATKAFFESVNRGKFVLLISEETIRELFDAPDAVRSFWEGLSNEALERVAIDGEVKDLAEKYIQAGVLGPASASDALHVAMASVARADLILSWNFTAGKLDGHGEAMRRFFESFMEELSRQVTLGREATDGDYLLFQKTVNSNVRRNAQIRNEILLRKLLVFQPAFADVLGVSVIAESGIAQSLLDAGKRVAALIKSRNEEYSRDHGEDLFKATNKTTTALVALREPLRDYRHYRDWLDGLYFLFRESVGQRLDGAWPQSFADVNVLRTAERHDVDHGEAGKVAAKRLGVGRVFKKYSGVTTPSTLAPEHFVVVQARMQASLESDLRTLKWR